MKKVISIAICIMLHAPLMAMRPVSFSESSSDENTVNGNSKSPGSTERESLLLRRRSSSGSKKPIMEIDPNLAAQIIRSGSPGKRQPAILRRRGSSGTKHITCPATSLPTATAPKQQPERPSIPAHTKRAMLTKVGKSFSLLKPYDLEFATLNFVILSQKTDKTELEKNMLASLAQTLAQENAINPKRLQAALEHASHQREKGLYAPSDIAGLYRPIEQDFFALIRSDEFNDIDYLALNVIILNKNADRTPLEETLLQLCRQRWKLEVVRNPLLTDKALRKAEYRYNNNLYTETDFPGMYRPIEQTFPTLDELLEWTDQERSAQQ